MIRPLRPTFAAMVLAFGLCGRIPAFAQQSDPVLDRIKANGAVAIGLSRDREPLLLPRRAAQSAGYSIDLCMRAVETIAPT